MQLYLKTRSGQARPIPSEAGREVQGGVWKLALLGLWDGTSSWCYLFRGDPVKIIRVGSSAVWPNPYRKGVTGHGPTHRMPREGEGSDQGDAPTSPWILKTAGIHQELGGMKDSPSPSSEGIISERCLQTPRPWPSGLPNQETTHFFRLTQRSSGAPGAGSVEDHFSRDWGGR